MQFQLIDYLIYDFLISFHLKVNQEVSVGPRDWMCWIMLNPISPMNRENDK